MQKSEIRMEENFSDGSRSAMIDFSFWNISLEV